MWRLLSIKTQANLRCRNMRSLESVIDTVVLGIGIGSSRASSWIIAVVSQLGEIGIVDERPRMLQRSRAPARVDRCAQTFQRLVTPAQQGQRFGIADLEAQESQARSARQVFEVCIEHFRRPLAIDRARARCRADAREPGHRRDA